TKDPRVGSRPPGELHFLVCVEALGNVILPTRIFSIRQEIPRMKLFPAETKRPVLSNGPSESEGRLAGVLRPIWFRPPPWRVQSPTRRIPPIPELRVGP